MKPQIRFCTSADGTRIAYGTMVKATLKGFEKPVRLHEVVWQGEH